MGSILSKFFGYITQSSSVSLTTTTGIEARNNSQVVVQGNVIVGGSSGIPEQKKPLIPIHSYPECSKYFSGRGDVLSEVNKSIILCEKEKTSLQRIVAIIGLGGMGKSEIAKVLAKELQSKYEYIFWFDAQTKTSLESDLRRLASILKISWTSKYRDVESVLWDVYHHLAQNYNNGIFIFDNAEVLRAEQVNFALEKYLLPDSHCKKPVFLVTSRNPMDSECDDIKCVRLKQLTDEDSEHCMLSILRIENHPLPPSLKEGITSLVKMTEGHPLGLTLIGQGLYYEMDSIQLNKAEIESRVRSYIKLLKDSGLKDIPGQSNYEANLQVITDLTIEKLLKTNKGNIAVELLNIVALLSPDDIHAGLVNGIYCEKPFEAHKVLCPQFVEDDLEITVRSGLKLLLSSSLLKIESKAYEGGGYQCKYDMIKIHRLIQQSVQNTLIRQNKTVEPLERILRSTERNRLKMDHAYFLLQFCLLNRLAYVHPEKCCLQILVMSSEEHTYRNMKSTYGVLLDQLLDQTREVLGTKKEELHPDCSKALCLFETYLGIVIHTSFEGNFDQLKRSIEELSPEFSKQRWLLQLVMLIVYKLHDRRRCLPQEAQRLEHLAHWVVKHYIDGKDDSRRDLKLTEFVEHLGCYRNHYENRDWSAEGEFLSKLFDCTSEECVGKVAEFPEPRASLLATEGFVSSLWDLTEFGFRKLSCSWEYMNNVRDTLCFKRLTQRLGFLLEAWCNLFVHDVDLYRSFGEKLDSEVEDLLGRPWDKKSLYKLSSLLFSRYSNNTRYFAANEHCSPRTRNWIQKLLEYEKQWEKARTSSSD